MFRWRYVLPAAVIIVAGALLYPTLLHQPLPEFANYFAKPHALNAFHLKESDGTSFTKDELKGRWSFVFIGYTFCPDICPTTLADLRAIYPTLKETDPSSQVVFVSVDPKRDDLQRLSGYTRFFSPEFKAVTGTQVELYSFVRNLGLVYSIVDEDAERKDYLIDHSASIVLINPDGDIQAVFRPEPRRSQPPEVSMQKMAADFSRIVALYHSAS